MNCKVTINNEGLTNGSELSKYEFEIAEIPATSSDNDTDNIEPDEDADIGYASTKAMADANHKVSLLSFLQN